MKKRGLFTTMFLFLIGMSSTVSAADMGSILPVFRDLGDFLFRDLPLLGDFGFKFLLWIGLFALFNFGLKKAFDGRTAGIAAFSLSLASVLLIPHGIVTNILSTYATILVFFLGVFLPVLLVWIVQKSAIGQSAHGHFLQALMYFVVSWALFNFTQYMSNAQFTVLGGLLGWVNLVAGLFLLLGLFKLLGRGGEQAYGAGLEKAGGLFAGGGEPKEEKPSWFDRIRGGHQKKQAQNIAQDTEMEDSIKKIQKDIEDAKGTGSRAEAVQQIIDKALQDMKNAEINSANATTPAGKQAATAQFMNALETYNRALTNETQIANHTGRIAHEIGQVATDVAAGATAQQLQERQESHAEKKAGAKEEAKDSKLASGAAAKEKRVARHIKHEAKEAEDASKDAIRMAQENVKLMVEIQEIMKEIHGEHTNLVPAQTKAKQKMLSVLLKKLFGKAQKITVAKTKVKKAYESIADLETKLENFSVMKKKLDMLKAAEEQK